MNIYYSHLFYAFECFACMHVCPQWPADSCEVLCRCWKPNLGPLQEQQVRLTAEPSLSLTLVFKKLSA